MPFTPSHVAAVIPLISTARVRKVLDPWALGIGSMVPDLPMFLPYLDAYSRWHSPLGVVTNDVLATAVLLALFALVFRDPLTALLPAPVAARVAALPGPAWRAPHTIALGAAAGAATHVLWDSFTHDWGAEFWGWSWMSASVFGWVPGYRLMQYACSALGLAAVAWWVTRALRSPGTIPAPVPPRLAMPEKLRRAVLACTAAGACCTAAVWPLVDPPNPAFGWAHVVTRTGVGLIVGFCVVLTTYTLLWHLTRSVRALRP
ncbi:hypothetical protein Skr01_63390 [Sphaerisporangium krabiense]|uniref:DUF4184 domain-containing protein n=1 Tax=Sphaerisporangium krabiense TaxID=763782 RepID=A0A7W8Z714_9ACTN|nr:DUF4184 family protein [Sphaerisporangium krabiense]MBB5628258.1 hypothetical protein [Sphaerisporangium krabiense]GII66254.1 hypothetical protein Skr01_63390 [Sphaerisporangium krabiense]